MIGKFRYGMVPMCSRRISPGMGWLLIRTVLSQNPNVSRFSKDFEGLIELLAGVLAGHDGADAGFAFGTVGKAMPVPRTPASKGRARNPCLAAVADDDGRDRVSLAGY